MQKQAKKRVQKAEEEKEKREAKRRKLQGELAQAEGKANRPNLSSVFAQLEQQQQQAQGAGEHGLHVTFKRGDSVEQGFDKRVLEKDGDVHAVLPWLLLGTSFAPDLLGLSKQALEELLSTSDMFAASFPKDGNAQRDRAANAMVPAWVRGTARVVMKHFTGPERPEAGKLCIHDRSPLTHCITVID